MPQINITPRSRRAQRALDATGAEGTSMRDRLRRRIKNALPEHVWPEAAGDVIVDFLPAPIDPDPEGMDLKIELDTTDRGRRAKLRLALDCLYCCCSAEGLFDLTRLLEPIQTLEVNGLAPDENGIRSDKLWFFYNKTGPFDPTTK